MLSKRVSVAIDGSAPSSRGLASALEVARTGARLFAVAVEGPLPAYAVGELAQVTREEDRFVFHFLGSAAADEGRVGNLDFETEVRPEHAAGVIVRYADECGIDRVVGGCKLGIVSRGVSPRSTKGHFLEDYCSGRPPTVGSPATPRARS